MLNYAIHHELPGANHSMCICTCGHEEKIEKDIGHFRPLNKCPKCNAEVAAVFSTLSFAPQDYKAVFFMINELDGKYNFTIDVGMLTGAVKAKFSKKIIAFEESKLEQKHWKIIFNGSLPKDEMLKIINADTNESCDIYDIIDSVEDAEYNYKFLHTRFNLNNSQALDLPYIYNVREFKHKLLTIYNRIDKLISYCEKYELLIKAGIDPYRLNGPIDLEQTTPQQQLRLTPFMFKYLKEHGEENHRALQNIEINFKNQAHNYMNTFAKLNNGMSSSYIRKIAGLVNEANLSIKKLYKFLYVDAPMQQGLYQPARTLELLYDSFDLAKKLELPFDKNPKALQRYHDILTKEYNLVKDERKNEDFAKVVANYKYLELIEPIEEEEEVNEEIKTRKLQDKFGIILPIDAQDLIREGKLMKHCVASYVDRVIREDTIIVFLRRAQDLDTPFVTIEVNPDDMKICQVKTKANGKLNNKKATDFINKWCDKHNIKWNGCW